MAYLDCTSLHALPANIVRNVSEPEPFGTYRDSRLARGFHQDMGWRCLDNRFLLTDQGPPMYRLLGAHYNMYQIPPKSDYHTYARSYHYEPRQYNAPNYRNGCLTFPPGPPPVQIALGGDSNQRKPFEPKMSMSLKAWDKYRYLHGPPTKDTIFHLPTLK